MCNLGITELNCNLGKCGIFSSAFVIWETHIENHGIKLYLSYNFFCFLNVF